MILQLVLTVLFSLILTIIIEIGVWKSLNLMFKTYDFEMIIASIIAINIATNPAFNILSTLLDPSRTKMFLELGFEVVIIVVEACLLYIIYRKEFKKLLLLSTAMNIISYGIGLLLFRPIWL